MTRKYEQTAVTDMLEFFRYEMESRIDTEQELRDWKERAYRLDEESGQRGQELQSARRELEKTKLELYWREQNIKDRDKVIEEKSREITWLKGVIEGMKTKAKKGAKK